MRCFSACDLETAQIVLEVGGIASHTIHSESHGSPRSLVLSHLHCSWYLGKSRKPRGFELRR